MQRNFLIVAGSGKVREGLAGRLRERGFSVTLAETGAEAVRTVRTVSVDTVLLESRGPDARIKRIRSQIRRARPGCRVFLITGFDGVKHSADMLRFGVDDFIVDADGLLDLATAPYGGEPAADRRGTRALVQVLDVLVGLLELDDRYFGGFSHQVLRLARAVAEEMDLAAEAVDEVVIATLLRDIGKAGVDRDVLFEENEYSAEQSDLMREHVTGSVRLLEHIDFPWKILPVIRHHHERYDGNGYPDGLKGREIPLGSRIVAVVDAYMAMVSDRPHRDAMASDDALAELERQAGGQFDPEVVEVFIRVVEKRHLGAGPGAKPSVLLVDAQEDFRRLLKMRLLNEGFEVTAAAELDAVLEVLTEHPPNLVVAGAGAGGARALDTLERIREIDALRAVPFVFLASDDDRVLKLRALRHGVDDFFTKHDDLEEMVARIENILAREAQRRAGATSRRRRGITGQLETLALPDIVQMLVVGVKTACISVSSAAGSGKVWMRDGAVVHAKSGSRTGESAFYALLRMNEGGFSIQHGVKTSKRTIETDSMFLIMEGLRRIDEENAASDRAAG